MRRAVLFASAALALGCDEPLKAVELIAETRVLGARVEVAGAPERAAPEPGESATVRFLVASPELAPSLGFALRVCPAAERRGGRSECSGEPFAQISSEDGAAGEVGFTFDVPAELRGAPRLAVLGVICPGGSPDAGAAGCDGPDAGRQVSLELELSRPGDVNLNPTLEAEAIELDEQEWPELPAAEGDCAGAGHPEVDAGSKHVIQVALDEQDRDPLPVESELDPAREALQLSHFTTAGDLSRVFQSVAWDSRELSRRVEWTAPAEPGLVRFWLVLRDFRGGGDFTERAVCVR